MVEKSSKFKKEYKLPSPTEGPQQQINLLTIIMVGVIIVLLIGFITMFATVGTLVWNAHLFGQSTYQELINNLKEQNDKIDILLEKTIETP